MPTTPRHIAKSHEALVSYESKLKKILVDYKGVDPARFDSQREQYFSSLNEASAKVSSLSFPSTVNVELINKCNYKCHMCYTVNHDGPSSSLSFESFKKVIDECLHQNLLTLFIANGSEPLIFPEFHKFLTYATERIPDVGVFTNGVKLDSKMVAFLLNSGVTRVNISLDAATPKTYQAIRGGNLDQVESNIEYLLKSRTKESGPLVRVSFCVQDLNRHEINLFRQKWEPLVDSVEFQSLHVFNNLSDLESGEFLFTDQFPDSFDRFCYSPFSYLAIWSDGTISPCCTFHGQKLPLGNINNSSVTLSNVWNGSYMSSLRNQFRSHQINPVCQDCLSCTAPSS